MVKMKLSRMLDSLCLAFDSNTCFCINSVEAHEDDEEFEQERKPLFVTEKKQSMTLKDAISGPQSLALLMKPKTVVLKVSMHCQGCAKKVEKHISKIEGVMSYKVDLESKMVVVIGDILPYEVVESISKVKNAQLWTFGV
ncbi:hypothetical protein BVRB_8g195980 [Beta vulgaris subsp. vulgaris]|uniref:protein SODIUM POTASSIUM ROOT DEFECTIVE 3 n=1 Tax=Beta vulgaris subsp. vulgaris TaxID=3555 RepID=UPI00053F8EDE|nr:protein SODIUM POTASSIUM ROOT DEFECTIVE 3 [Beta vulgaris subsp. vulgaris]KMT03036.1 hypothetical protein BVRB_8g195980 [Beta vulgaris subsp. vulgaris]